MTMANGNNWNKVYKAGVKNYAYYDFSKPHPDLNRFTRILKKSNKQQVLDLGCGAGRNLIPLVKSGFTVQGIDNAGEGLKIIKKALGKRTSQVKLAQRDIYKKLPFAPSSFDAIIAIQVLQHASEKKIIECIGELSRILKDEGLIFITVCGRYSKGKLREYLVKTAKRTAPHTYVPTKGDENGLTHFIYNKALIKKHFRGFQLLAIWKDKKDYYCFIAKKKPL